MRGDGCEEGVVRPSIGWLGREMSRVTQLVGLLSNLI